MALTPEQKRKARVAARKRAIRARIFLFTVIILIIVITFFGFRSCGKQVQKSELEILNQAINEKYFKDTTAEYINLDEYYIYGTYLNLKGSIDLEDGKTVEDMKLFFADKDGNEKKYSISYESQDNKLNYYLSTEINDGIHLDELPEGNFIPIIEITYSDYISKYYMISNKTSYPDLEYYTVTKNNSNNKIYIDGTGTNLVITVKQSELPEGVFDIVIDAGHGGKDSGAINGNHYESNIAMDYAKSLKSSLEKLGLKVKLTRDGTESDTKDTVYNSYDSDGRVDITCSSGAKYCLSIHLNSNEAELNSGGVEIFAPGNANLYFASLLAENIVNYANTQYSSMGTYKVEPGVYVRNFTQNDIADMKDSANAAGYKPYDITLNTPYLFMIRETGGFMTGAFADGRNKSYGINRFMDSNKGVETYILELGYISEDSDLQNILNNKNDYIDGIINAIKDYFGL